MRLAVPTNWDTSLIGQLADIESVDSVYGGIPFLTGSGGRPTSSLTAVNPEQVEEYIRLLHTRGISFSYTLNATCLGNMEWDIDFNKKLFNHLQWLTSIGVDTVIVAIPHLVELIKSYFPGFRIKVSTLARVSTVPRAKLYEKMGADALAIDFHINRDFKTLRAIRDAVNCDLEILLNNSCLYDCPWHIYHANSNSHSNESNNPGNALNVDSHIIRCGIEKYSDLSQIIKSRWIRPEDIAQYEEMGYEFFKISGRTMSTPWIINTLKSYSARKHDGNLLEIIEIATDAKAENLNPSSVLAQLAKIGPELATDKDAVITKLKNGNTGLYEKLIDMESFRTLLKTPRPQIVVNNALLEGFIEFFKSKDCRWECAYCHYCEDKTREVITADMDEITEYIFAITNFMQDFGRVMGYETLS